MNTVLNIINDILKNNIIMYNDERVVVCAFYNNNYELYRPFSYSHYTNFQINDLVLLIGQFSLKDIFSILYSQISKADKDLVLSHLLSE